MEAVLAGHDRAVFVCGIARNQDELRDLFDRVFLLRIDGPTQETRLAAYDAQHPPGRSEAGRNEIREGRTVFETQMLRAGAIALDGTAPTAMVADELISLAAADIAPSRSRSRLATASDALAGQRNSRLCTPRQGSPRKARGHT